MAATLDRLVKAFEALRVFNPSESEDDQEKKLGPLGQKERASHLETVCDCICSLGLRSQADFPKFLGIALETFLNLCDDAESDVRMTAEECLNRTIKALLETNLGRIQVELYKEIKKNGSPRTLRAALWRFGELCHLIRPQKCRPYVLNLLPCIVRISRRDEESVQETLASSMHKICSILMRFAVDTEIESLMKTLLPNLGSESPATRRTAANCLVLVCTNSRRPVHFSYRLLGTLLGLIVPVQNSAPVPQLVGVFQTFRHLIPTFTTYDRGDEIITGSFGQRRQEEPVHKNSLDQFCQVFEVLLYYITHADHNVTTSALESMQQLLKSPPPGLIDRLVTERSIPSVGIFGSPKNVKPPEPARLEGENLRLPSVGDDSMLEDESDKQILLDPGSEDIEHSVEDDTVFSSDSDSADCSETAVNVQSLSTYSFAEFNQDELKEQPEEEAETYPEDMDMTREDSETGEVTLSDGIIGCLHEIKPLLYLARLLASKFLLSGRPGATLSDRTSRVSVKALSLNCIAVAVSYLPTLLTCDMYIEGEKQKMSDVLVLNSHHDPQIRGQVMQIVCNFISAVLILSRGSYSDWLTVNCRGQTSDLGMDKLFSIMSDVTGDTSSVTVRLALNGLKTCLNSLLNSHHGQHGLKLLRTALLHRSSPYWLVKIELLELLQDLDYRVLAYLESKATPKVVASTQDLVVEDVFIYLLGDDDLRVRHAAADTIPKLVAKVFYPTSNHNQDSVVCLARQCTEELFDPIMTEWSKLPTPLIHGLQEPYHFDPLIGHQTHVTANLSRLLTLLYDRLLQYDSRSHQKAGCFLALEKLAVSYTTTQYSSAWNFQGRCGSQKPVGDDMVKPCGGGLLSMITSYLTSSHLSLTLNVHEDLLNLAGYLIAGIATDGLRHLEDVSKSNNTDHWQAISDRKVATLLDKVLNHLIKLLNLCSSIIEEQNLPQPVSKPVLAQLTTPSLSPIKIKKIKDEGELLEKKVKKEKEIEEKKQKKEGGWMFYSSLHYTRLHDILKGAYTNYQTSIAMGVSDKFCRLVTTALGVLSKLLELAILSDVAPHAEEILGLLKTLITIDATSSVFCVQQLLKALFGMNLVSLWSEDYDIVFHSKSVPARVGSDKQRGMYHYCFTKPYTQLTQILAASQTKLVDSHESQATFLSWVKRSSERRVPAILKPGSQADKSSISAYIRLFEPLVIRALKLYTITCSMDLQCCVLDLLTQLIMLRVNYCLLDSDQVFIGFIMKQFEYIEEGHIRNSELLIPHVFKFLVLLSYERYHSKAIVGMPKVIQLCDGIMANDLQPVTHVVPALRFIVLDLFAVRQVDASSDLETQREVVVSMLLRLVQYHQVIELLIIVLSHLNQDNEERWKRLSRHVVDLVLPLLEKQDVDIADQAAMDVVHRLFEVVPPSVFRPVDTLVRLLMETRPSLDNYHRYLAFVNIILRVLITKAKENVILSRIHEIKLEYDVGEKLNGVMRSMESSVVSTDSESLDSVDGASSAEFCLARCLLSTVSEASLKLCSMTKSLHRLDTRFTAKLLGHFLMYLTHMFQSGTFSRTASATKRLLMEPDESYLSDLNAYFLELRNVWPTLTMKWCHLLTLLNYDGTEWWTDVLLQKTSNPMTVTPYQEVVRRGSLMLLCDNVCENIFGAETKISVIVNHVNDLIHLSHEPPVQDFINAVHRNPSASGLFIQAIQSRCRPMSSGCKTLRCLEAAHLSQSISLLSLLLDRFLPSHRLSSARLADSMACRRLEMLLSEPKEELRQQITPESLASLLNKMEDGHLAKRHPRLHSLLLKLYSQQSGEERTTIGGTHPITSIAVTRQYLLTKEAFYAITQDRACAKTACGRECAMLLQWLDYQDANAIMSLKNFNLNVLLECIALGVHKTLIMVNKSRDSTSSQSDMQSYDPLLMAAQRTLFKRIRTVVSVLPAHQHVLKRGAIVCHDKTYLDQILVLLTDQTLVKNCHLLVESLVKYLVSLNLIPKKPKIPNNALQEIIRFCAFHCEICTHSMLNKISLSSSTTVTLLELISSVTQQEDLVAAVSEPKHHSLIFTYIAALHLLMTEAVIYPNIPDWISESAIAEYQKSSDVIAAWQEVGDLLHLLRTLKNEYIAYRVRLPAYVKNSVENAIRGLCRLPVLNSFAVIPRVVWKMHWRPDLCSETTAMPPLPLDYLQEAGVLRDFIFATQSLGWTCRQQFEETWMSLLGVINPVQMDEHEPSPEEVIERSQCTVLAIRGITRLLIQTLRYPNPGNTCNSIYPQPVRERVLPFLNTRNGRKLAIIRGLLEKEIQPASRSRSRINTHHHYTTMGHDSHKFKYFYDGTVERVLGCEEYDIHQMSVEAIWSNIGVYEDSDEIFSPRAGRGHTASLSGLDIHSCLQFLIELYQQWFTPGTKIPLMQLNEAIKSVVILSDLFTERGQFDWMLDNLLEVQKFHPFEDELTNQYCVIGLCKSAAVVGMDIVILEKVSRTLDQAFKSTHLASRIGALYGSLYLLEAGMTEGLRALMPSILTYILRYLTGNLTLPTIVSCEHHSLLLWAAAFYLMEHYADDIDDVDFHNRVFQSALQILVGPEQVSLNIYMAVCRGMERLVVAEAFSQAETDALIKTAKDKLASQNPQRVLSALGLLLTCVYTGKRGDVSSASDEPPADHDPDLLLADMERIALLFDRTRKGYPLEANVISRILPTLLTDFFPPQDVMNKVICEFLSNQQTHPQLMCKVVFQVFNSLQQQRQFSLVRDWVMLSLSNFTQRTPLSMAIWSLTCFLVSASTNQWLRGLLHHIVERMGKVDAPDTKLFCMAAVDFYSQIQDENSKGIFKSTFQKLSLPNTPYLELMNCLEK